MGNLVLHIHKQIGLYLNETFTRQVIISVVRSLLTNGQMEISINQSKLSIIEPHEPCKAATPLQPPRVLRRPIHQHHPAYDQALILCCPSEVLPIRWQPGLRWWSDWVNSNSVPFTAVVSTADFDELTSDKPQDCCYLHSGQRSHTSPIVHKWGLQKRHQIACFVLPITWYSLSCTLY